MKKLCLLALLALILVGCNDTAREAEISGDAQGTTYHIKLVLNSQAPALEEVRHQIARLLSEIDAQMSNYREDSEISRVNARETVDWLPVSPEIVGLLAIADQVYRRSEGCYDLTIKPLFDLWGFSGHENRIPGDHEIATLMPHIGMPLLEIDAAGQRIRKKDPKIKIDLSSIAQGYSVGVIAKRLDALGIEDYLVEIGGEMLVKGRKANGTNWHIGVETPSPSGRGLQKIIDVKDTKGTAVMTAGTYRNFFVDKGQNYSHILSPKTGRPVNHHLRSLTVVHDNPTWADAWDTALLCVGESKAMQIAEAENLKVLLVYENDNKLKEYTSKSFDASQ